jgi:phosphatidylserine decarboxylase
MTGLLRPTKTPTAVRGRSSRSFATTASTCRSSSRSHTGHSPNFFDRGFKRGAFLAPKGEMGAFAEARYFAWEKLKPAQQLPLKGKSPSRAAILGDEARAQRFDGGPVILARLAPVDYHHLHYPDAGSTVYDHRLRYRLWTVTWHALQNMDDILFRNERQINILDTQHFGRIAFVEVGAMSVGRIMQMHPLDQLFERDAEKSVFKFGGSAVVVFGEPGALAPRR